MWNCVDRWNIPRFEPDSSIYNVEKTTKKNQKKKTAYFFVFCFWLFFSRIKHSLALYFTTTMPDPVHHAASHSSSPTTTSKILSWSSTSPDLNLNKHTWNELETRVRGRVNAPENVRELFQALKQEWVAIPAQVIYLSLIHIWRCRRNSACRSRWSPYH